MTVARLRAEMSNDEYMSWMALYKYEHAMANMTGWRRSGS